MTYEQALQIAIEQLDDAVDYLRATNKGFPRVEKQIEEYASASDVLKEMQAKCQADLKIGAWLSAALEDPSTCQSMKDDINEWFKWADVVEAKLKKKNAT